MKYLAKSLLDCHWLSTDIVNSNKFTYKLTLFGIMLWMLRLLHWTQRLLHWTLRLLHWLLRYWING